ncbi:DUF4232 domain-containing protein [Actinacidiphila sp. bgisy144]|uniref:DUF4232 domain-containing protein n=1 Tax=Actinacidiphila sp. bgisy144 TaxID=3413791 RepID=UPI003EBDE67D
MFSIRTTRTRTARAARTRTSGVRLAGAAAAVVVAALSLTACSDDGTGSRAEGAANGVSTTKTADPAVTLPADQAQTPTAPAAQGTDPAKAPAADDTSGKNTGSGNSGNSGTSAGNGNSGNSSGTGKAVTCEASNTKTVAAPLTRPVNHLLLTVTNTGTHTCYLYGYPELDFTGAQAVPPVIDDSQPQAVVTLNPGESGYASVSLSATDGSGKYGYTAKTLDVLFQPRSLSGSVGGAAHPALPPKGVYIDDTLTTTYWQQSMDDALSW